MKVEEGLETYVIDQIYNQRFKYLNCCWIQQSVVNVGSRRFKRASVQCGYTNRSYKKILTTYTTI
jgi:hypothetical protein